MTYDSYRIDPRSDLQFTAMMNAHNAETLGQQPLTAFNTSAAEMTLRNMSVLTDRLNPLSFNRLSDTTQAAAKQFALDASFVAPVELDNLDKRPDETDMEYDYRTWVALPMHSLQALAQSAVRLRDMPELRQQNLQHLVEASGTIFATLISETLENATILTTAGYFRNNTVAAAKSITRLSESRD